MFYKYYVTPCPFKSKVLVKNKNIYSKKINEWYPNDSKKYKIPKKHLKNDISTSGLLYTSIFGLFSILLFQYFIQIISYIIFFPRLWIVHTLDQIISHNSPAAPQPDPYWNADIVYHLLLYFTLISTQTSHYHSHNFYITLFQFLL